jgi:isoamylase
MTAGRMDPGAPHPLGATLDGRGVNFALFAEHATAVDLCLFDADDREVRIRVPWRTAHVWHLYLAGIAAGQRYGWRVHGPYRPRDGDRFNANKLLVDPYARALSGFVDQAGPIFAYPRDLPTDDLTLDERDDAASTPKAVVVDSAFDWRGDAPPSVPWGDAVLYEVHVKGFTKLHPRVPERLRGTFLGLASDPVIEHLTSIGVNTLELMPVHEHLDEPAVVARGKTNYWGYSTLAFFAPARRFATAGGDAVREFKEMVLRLHAAGIEVILDVVYNHTCEGDELGPTVSWRGIDNRAYYRRRTDDPRRYVDFSGCGNTLNVPHPQTLKLVADSLRYWVTEMRVGGFRFDLASALARAPGGEFDHFASFLSTIHQDPVLSRVRLIAEPWDLGAGGYQVGGFPVLWSEWNGRYRDTVRSFWKGEAKVVADLGYRLTGSSDLFASGGRQTDASINFVTAHDGFTLRDLVSYEKKHNEANGEDNRDGLDDNASQNCGVEGETLDAEIRAHRRTLARSMLATLLLSQGAPMMSMGDEMWRTQYGNNNPYCHDSELTWLHWPDVAAGAADAAEQLSMLEFVRSLVALRKSHPALRRRSFLRGVAIAGGRPKDIVWLRTDGAEMGAEDWAAPELAAIAFRLDGAIEEMPPGAVPRDDSVLVMMNGEREPTSFVLPDAALGGAWKVVLDTREASRLGEVKMAGGALDLEAASLVVWVEVRVGAS